MDESYLDPTLPQDGGNLPESDSEHLSGAAPEEGLIRLEVAHRLIGERMRRIAAKAPHKEPEFRAGDPA